MGGGVAWGLAEAKNPCRMWVGRGTRGVASLTAKLGGMIELTRPHNILVALVTTYIGYGMVYKMLHGFMGIDYWFIPIALTVAFVAAAGYVINDYFDIEIDVVNKPERPIPSGRVTPREALLEAIILAALGVATASMIGLYSYTFACINMLILFHYSSWIKKTGFPGNLAIAFNSASSIIYGGLAYMDAAHFYRGWEWIIVPALYAFLLVLGREIVKGIEDYIGDSKEGVKTLAVVMGPRRAAKIASIILAAVVALSPLPMLTGIYNLAYLALAVAVDILCIASIKVILTSPDPVKEAAKPRRWLKIAFLLGGLAFILGLA